jgi:probable rRNA maturation factor
MTVSFADDQDDPLPAASLVALAQSVLEAEGFPADAEVSLQFVSADRIAGLNQEHMGRSGPTDVLSFPLEDLRPGVVPEPVDGGPPLLLGDVMVCPQVVRANAAEWGVPFDSEMALMVVHGMLHLLGYDHVEDAEAERMETREREILAATGRERP